jgi:hypothetical protein
MICENLAVKNVKSAMKTDSKKDREVIGTA